VFLVEGVSKETHPSLSALGSLELSKFTKVVKVAAMARGLGIQCLFFSSKITQSKVILKRLRHIEMYFVFRVVPTTLLKKISRAKKLKILLTL
jgi:hypothetical protein